MLFRGTRKRKRYDQEKRSHQPQANSIQEFNFENGKNSNLEAENELNFPIPQILINNPGEGNFVNHNFTNIYSPALFFPNSLFFPFSSPSPVLPPRWVPDNFSEAISHYAHSSAQNEDQGSSGNSQNEIPLATVPEREISSSSNPEQNNQSQATFQEFLLNQSLNFQFQSILSFSVSYSQFLGMQQELWRQIFLPLRPNRQKLNSNTKIQRNFNNSSPLGSLLGRRNFSQRKNHLKFEKCPICREEKYLVSSKCAHDICLTCWTKWLEKRRTCPLCRGRTSLRDIIKPPSSQQIPPK